MIAIWNAAIDPDDEVWHLGDFAVRQTPRRVADLLGELNGRKHLVSGNNDNAAVTECSLWASVQAYAEVTTEETSFVLCHYPFRTWRDMSRGAINLHGHSHGRLTPLRRQFDVGVDAWEFRPIRFVDLIGRTASGRVARRASRT